MGAVILANIIMSSVITLIEDMNHLIEAVIDVGTTVGRERKSVVPRISNPFL